MRASRLGLPGLGLLALGVVGLGACSLGLDHGDGDGPQGPAPPADLTRWFVGNPDDARVTPAGPALVLLGGGADVDAAFTWWAPRLGGGDVVVLRESGGGDYGPYLMDFGADSVETLRVDTRALADSDYVAARLGQAEGIFLAGGDQSAMLAAWRGTRLSAALDAAWRRGAILGGTSAGAMLLGQFIYAADGGSITSAQALLDPYDPDATLARDFVAVAPLAGVLVDTHFKARKRMGRLVAFLARVIADGWSDHALGLGVDQGTALVVDETGHGQVLGDGVVYVVTPSRAPESCQAGQPLVWTGLTVTTLAAGDTVDLPGGQTSGTPRSLSAGAGDLDPADPY